MTRLWWLAAFFTVALVRSMTDGIGLVDESWFLQVIARVRAGDVLYRDLFFGATPLSVWLTAAITWLTGVDVIAVKVVTNAAFAATTLITWLIGLRAGLAPGVSAAVAALVLVFGRPYTSPLHSARHDRVHGDVGARPPGCRSDSGAVRKSVEGSRGGLAAGLAFLTKPNVGLLAGVAATVTLALGPGNTATERARRLADFAIPALLVVLTGMGAVWTSGGLPMLLDYVFLNKVAYVEHGVVPYTATIEQWLAPAATPWSAATLNEFARGTILLLPVAVGILAAVRWKRIGSDPRLAALLVFAAAATTVAYPRWNRYHMAYSLPCLLMALAAFGAGRDALARRPWPATGGLAAGAALMAALCLLLVPTVGAIVHGARFSELPHFSGALLSPAERARLAEAASQFTLAARSRPVFIVSPRAGFLYLASDVVNPTPYDFPSVTSVGRHGRARLLAAIAGGRLPVVCVGHDRRGLYYFEEIATAIETQLSPGPDVGLCRMYEQP